MPVRYAIERRRWAETADSHSSVGALPQVGAIAVWARAVGLSRGGKASAAEAEVQTLRQLEEQLRAPARSYWAAQVHIQVLEASGWVAQANGKTAEAETLLHRAAEEEDSLEKLPVTPGPIVPAREQLGDLLLQQGRPQQALAEFEASLLTSPGRRGALQGGLAAAEQANDEPKARQYRAALQRNR